MTTVTQTVTAPISKAISITIENEKAKKKHLVSRCWNGTTAMLFVEILLQKSHSRLLDPPACTL